MQRGERKVRSARAPDGPVRDADGRVVMVGARVTVGGRSGTVTAVKQSRLRTTLGVGGRVRVLVDGDRFGMYFRGSDVKLQEE